MAGPLATKIRAKFPGVYDDLDDATLEAKVLAAHPQYKDLATPTAPEERTLAGFGQNVLKSGGRMVGGLVDAAMSPIQTGKGILRLAKGAAELAMPTTFGVSEDIQGPLAIADQYKQRYGGIENIKDTLYNDPVGAAADISTVALPFAGLPGKVGKFAATLSDVTNPVNMVTSPLRGALQGSGTMLAHVTNRPGTQLTKQAGVQDKFRIAREIAGKGLWNTERASHNLEGAITNAKEMVAGSNLPPTPRPQVVNFDNTINKLVGRAGSQGVGEDQLIALNRELVRDLPEQIDTPALYDLNKHANREANASFRQANREMPGGEKPASGLGWQEVAERSRDVLRDIPNLQGAQRDVQTAMLANGAVTTAKARPHALTRLLAVGAGASMRSPETAAAMIALDSPFFGAFGGNMLWRAGSAANNPAAVRAALLARLQRNAEQPPE
jgi:hypothetical protein